MSDEKEKKSWSERDRQKDRSNPYSKPFTNPSKQSYQDKKSTSEAKKKLEKLFSTSKVSKEKKKDLDSIRAARGSSDFYKKIDHYLDTHGIPLEWDAQMIVLDHNKSDRVIELLKEMKKQILRFSASEREILIQKLKVMELSCFDQSLYAQIQEMKAAL